MEGVVKKARVARIARVTKMSGVVRVAKMVKNPKSQSCPSSISVSWSGGGGVGLGDPQSNKIGYSSRLVPRAEKGLNLCIKIGYVSAQWYSILVAWRSFGVFGARFWLAADKNLVSAWIWIFFLLY